MEQISFIETDNLILVINILKLTGSIKTKQQQPGQKSSQHITTENKVKNKITKYLIINNR